MGAAVVLADVIGIAVNVLLVAFLPLQGRLHDDFILLLLLEVKHLADNLFPPIQVLRKGLQATFLEEGFLLAGALVLEINGDAGIQKASSRSLEAKCP